MFVDMYSWCLVVAVVNMVIVLCELIKGSPGSVIIRFISSFDG